MDAQTATIISSLFNIVFHALDDDQRQRICHDLEVLRTGPLVRPANQEFYRILLNSLCEPITETCDRVIEDTPPRERSSRLRPLTVIAGGAVNAQLEGGDPA